MAAKIQIKDTQIGSFGGIFQIFDRIDSTGLSGLIDRTLGPRCGRSSYSYSEIFKCFAAVYLCGGDAVEDINDFRGDEYTSNPSYRFCSPDTMLRSLSELSVGDTEVESACRAKYRFNINDRMNDLLVKSLLLSGLVKDRRRVTLDYDNQIIPTEKRDAKYTYKKMFGYFPGIAQIDLNPCYIENRDGNAPVKLEQDEVFDRLFKVLRDNGIEVEKARMDCGSYTADVVGSVAENCRWFYIRAAQCASLHAHYDDIADGDWKRAEIGHTPCELASIPFTAFFPERGYRLVVQRTKVTDKESALFDHYIHRCILTNDWTSSEEEIVRFYNQRGTSETTFDVMNNDFGWGSLPCSNKAQNTVFMILMAMTRNFYRAAVTALSEVREFKVEATSRVKRFGFRFMQVPFRWVRHGRQMILRLYTRRPYDMAFR